MSSVLIGVLVYAVLIGAAAKGPVVQLRRSTGAPPAPFPSSTSATAAGGAATITLSVTPRACRPGEEVSISWASSGDVVFPLTLYLRHAGDLTSSYTWALVDSDGAPLPDGDGALDVPFGAFPGEWTWFIQDAASIFSTTSPSVDVVLAVINPNPVAVYNATEALLPLILSSLAYAAPEALATWADAGSVCDACPGCAQVGLARAPPFITSGTTGFNQVFVTALADDTLVVAFRGTNSWDEFKEDISITMSTYKGCTGNADADCEVHTGFLDAYHSLAADLSHELAARVPTAELRASTRILVTGHSLGGAIATIAAYELALTGYRVVGVYTFGSPRVGTLAFAQAFDAVVGLGAGLYGAYAGEPLPLFHLLPVRADGSARAGGAAVTSAKGAAAASVRGRAAWPRDIPPGAGMTAAPLSGTWRVVGGNDLITAIPEFSPSGISYYHVNEYRWISSSDWEQEYLGTFDPLKRINSASNEPQRRRAAAASPLRAMQDHPLCVYAFRIAPLEFLGEAPLTGCASVDGKSVCSLGGACLLPNFINATNDVGTSDGALVNAAGKLFEFPDSFVCGLGAHTPSL